MKNREHSETNREPLPTEVYAGLIFINILVDIAIVYFLSWELILIERGLGYLAIELARKVDLLVTEYVVQKLQLSQKNIVETHPQIQKSVKKGEVTKQAALEKVPLIYIRLVLAAPTVMSFLSVLSRYKAVKSNLSQLTANKK